MRIFRFVAYSRFDEYTKSRNLFGDVNRKIGERVICNIPSRDRLFSSTREILTVRSVDESAGLESSRTRELENARAGGRARACPVNRLYDAFDKRDVHK